MFDWQKEVLEYVVNNPGHDDEIVFLTDGGKGHSGKTYFTKALSQHPGLNVITGSAPWDITSILMKGYEDILNTAKGERLKVFRKVVKQPINVICYDPFRANEWNMDVFHHIWNWKLMNPGAHVLIFLPGGLQNLVGCDKFLEDVKARIWFFRKGIKF
jgi:hypothetical protein